MRLRFFDIVTLLTRLITRIFSSRKIDIGERVFVRTYVWLTSTRLSKV